MIPTLTPASTLALTCPSMCTAAHGQLVTIAVRPPSVCEVRRSFDCSRLGLCTGSFHLAAADRGLGDAAAAAGLLPVLQSAAIQRSTGVLGEFTITTIELKLIALLTRLSVPQQPHMRSLSCYTVRSAYSSVLHFGLEALRTCDVKTEVIASPWSSGYSSGPVRSLGAAPGPIKPCKIRTPQEHLKSW